MDYDAIVVGAGPGGSTAAYELARRGMKVGLFEQKELPRYKPCGGCLSLKIDRILEPDFHPLVERTVSAATFTFQGLEDLRVDSARPVAYMVMRDRFDHFLAEKARRSGADLRPGERVLDASAASDEIRARTTRGEHTARFLVGADRANGIVARRLGLAPQRRVAVCIEAEVRTRDDMPQPPGDEVRIEIGAIPFGYGWIFPKGDHLSIGVGAPREKLDNPRALYDEFLVDEDLVDAIREEKRHGYVIPVFAGGRDPISTSRTVLVGDAAALVDPFLGEGIYYAIRSGQLTAEALAGAGAAPHLLYQELVEDELYPEFRAARKMALFLYAFPRVAFEILKRRRGFVEFYFDVLRGQASYADLWRELRSVAAGDLVRSLWPSGRRAATDVSGHYDRIAPRYDSALSVWRALVAAPAGETLRRWIGENTRPGAAVLDAGTGTGEGVQLVLECANPGNVVAVDISKGMLRAARKKIHDARVKWEQQDVTRLPYPDRSFDVVLSTWTLETLADPRQAVREFLRVIKEDGAVIYAFSSRSDATLARLYGRLLEEWSAGTLRGRFLAPAERPYHACGRSRVKTFAHGLATVVLLAKCCNVDDPDAPCLPIWATA